MPVPPGGWDAFLASPRKASKSRRALHRASLGGKAAKLWRDPPCGPPGYPRSVASLRSLSAPSALAKGEKASASICGRFTASHLPAKSAFASFCEGEPVALKDVELASRSWHTTPIPLRSAARGTSGAGFPRALFERSELRSRLRQSLAAGRLATRYPALAGRLDYPQRGNPKDSGAGSPRPHLKQDSTIRFRRPLKMYFASERLKAAI